MRHAFALSSILCETMARPLLSGWLILHQGWGVGGWGSEAQKKVVYLKSTSKFGPLR